MIDADEVAAVLAGWPFDDRLDRLAGHVAAEDHHVGAVRRAGVEELAEALLRAMDVGGEVQKSLVCHVVLPRPKSGSSEPPGPRPSGSGPDRGPRGSR